jgi:hypothetical protein
VVCELLCHAVRARFQCRGGQGWQTSVLRIDHERAPAEVRSSPLIQRVAAILLTGHRRDPLVEQRRLDDAAVDELAQEAFVAIVGRALHRKASRVRRQPDPFEIRIAPFGAGC